MLLTNTCFKKATKIDNCRRGVRRHDVRTSMQWEGPQSKFKTEGGGGGGAPLVPQYWGGGAQDTFSYSLFIILKTLERGACVLRPPYSAVPE